MHRSSLAALVAVVLVAAGHLAGAPVPTAHAKPEFAKKEGKACGFCHVNPKGGGALAAKGAEYKQGGFKFAVQGFGEDSAFTTEAAGKAFALVRKAIDVGHFSDALRRIGELRSKEKKGPGAQLLLNTETQVDNRGRDLLRVAKDAIQGGKVPEAAEALARVEAEFRGREAGREAGKVRPDFNKLPGAKEADAAAKLLEAQRLAWFDAQMREAEGKAPEALKLLRRPRVEAPGRPVQRGREGEDRGARRQGPHPGAARARHGGVGDRLPGRRSLRGRRPVRIGVVDFHRRFRTVPPLGLARRAWSARRGGHRGGGRRRVAPPGTRPALGAAPAPGTSRRARGRPIG